MINILQLNGSLSAFCDKAFRTDKIWSSEQLLEIYIKSRDDSYHAITTSDLANPEIQNFAIKYLQRRLESHTRNEKALLIGSAFSFCGNKKVSDIRYGWRLNTPNGTQRMKKSELPDIEDAFTVNHVNQYIPAMGHYTDIVSLLNGISTSHIEKIFYKAWIERFYSQETPALIPEVHRFSLGNESAYGRSFTYDEHTRNPKKGRMDYLVYNAKQEIVYFIELDGHQTHKTKEQRRIDAIKRNIAAEAGIPTIVLTSQMILDDLENTLKSVEFLFSDKAPNE
ncbi:DUF2726 domain-containing protein [Endozoicomonas sp. ALD040]|uniref:DUF2726 domain-containing protein n=1 Tax=Endozoicomonas sp. ALD040 TaxID=3403079 RepID=UPI003BB1100E